MKTVKPILTFAEVSTNMTGKFFFPGNGGGEHTGPTHLLDFAASAIWRTYGAPHNLYLKSLLVSLFSLMNLWIREHFTIPLSYLSRTPKLKYAIYYSLSEIEKNEINGLYFFLQNFFFYLPTVKSKKKRKCREATITSRDDLFHQIKVVGREMIVRGIK